MLVFLSIFHHREFISPALLSSLFLFSINYVFKLYPGGSEVKASACSVGNPGSIPGSGRSPGEGNVNPLHYSCLETPIDLKGTWWVTLHAVTKSQTRLSD